MSNFEVNAVVNLSAPGATSFARQSEEQIRRIQAIASTPITIPVSITSSGALSAATTQARDDALAQIRRQQLAIENVALGRQGPGAETRAVSNEAIARINANLAEYAATIDTEIETRRSNLSKEQAISNQKLANERTLARLEDEDLQEQAKGIAAQRALNAARERRAAEEALAKAPEDAQEAARLAAVRRIQTEAANREAIAAAKLEAAQNVTAATIRDEGKARAQDRITRLRVQNVENSTLAATNAYTDALINNTVSKNRLTVKEAEAALGNEILINSNVRAAVAKSQLAAQDATEVGLNAQVIQAKAAEAAATTLAAAQQQAANAAAIDSDTRIAQAKAREIFYSAQAAEQVREELRILATNNGLRKRETAQLLSRVTGGFGGGGGGGGVGFLGSGQAPGDFFGGGLRNVLRFALPSAALFGTYNVIKNIVREGEELIQINVRLRAQFENLSDLGVFDNLVEDSEELTTNLQRAAGAAALEEFQGELRGIAQSTGIATEQIFELGTRFVGLFATLDTGQGDLVGFSGQAVEIASQLALITGITVDEAFNDLTASIRAFADNGAEAVEILEAFSDDVISVSSATGVGADQIADFVGRVSALGESAGFAREELTAIAATLNQGSAVGSSALAEQFGRIISTFSENIGDELQRLAIEVPELNLDLADVTAGRSREVILQLVAAFDQLSAAQQQQVIASIGSRREGATLAVLLQNNEALFTALRAQVDNTGARLERFEVVIERLTGQFNRFKVSLEQLGQAALEGGLGNFLLGLVDALETVVDAFEVFGKIAGEVVGFLDFAIPDGAVRTTTEILALTAAVVALNKALRTLAATQAVQGALSAFGIGAQAAAAGAGAARGASQLLGPSGRPLQVAQTAKQTATLTAGLKALTLSAGRASLIVGGTLIAVDALGAAVNNLARDGIDADEVTKAFTESISTQGDEFFTAAEQARNYITELEVLQEAQIRRESFEPDARSRAQAEADAIAQIAAERGLTGILTTLREEYDFDIERIIDTAMADQAAFSGFLDSFDTGVFGGSFLGDALTLLDTPFEPFRNLLTPGGPAGFQTAEGESLKEIVDTLRDTGAFEEEELRQFVELVANIEQARGQAAENIEADAQKALFELGEALGLSDPEIRLELAKAATTAARLDISRAEAAILNLLQQRADQDAADFAASVEGQTEEAVQSIEALAAQFDAGLISIDTYAAGVQAEISKLQRILASEISQNRLEDAAETQEDINELLANLADAQAAQLRATLDFAELAAGGDIPFEQELNTLLQASAGRGIRASAEETTAIAEQIIQNRRDQFEVLAEAAETQEDLDRLINDFGFGAFERAVINRAQVLTYSGALAEILNAGREAGTTLENDFNRIEAELLIGRQLEEIIIDILLERLGRLTQTFGPGASGGSGDLTALAQVRATLEQIRTGGLGFGIIDPDDFVIGDVEEQAARLEEQRIENLRARSQAIVDSVNAASRIGSARGTETAGDQIARLVEAIQNPDLIVAEDIGALGLELASALSAYNELTGEEAQVALDAINESTSLAQAQEFAEIGLVFAALDGNQAALNALTNIAAARGQGFLFSIVQQAQATAIAAGQTSFTFAQLIDAAIAALEGSVSVLDFGFIPGFQENQSFIDLDRLTRPLKNLRADIVNFNPTIGSFGGGFGSPGAGGGGSDAEDAAKKLAEAEENLLRAKLEENELLLAQFDLEQAEEAVKEAENQADRLNARAEEIRARRSLRDVEREIFDAERAVLRALAESTGDLERVAEIDLRGSLRDFRQSLFADLRGQEGRGSLKDLVRELGPLLDSYLGAAFGDFENLIDGTFDLTQLTAEEVNEIIALVTEALLSGDFAIDAETLNLFAGFVTDFSNFGNRLVADAVDDLQFQFDIGNITQQALIAGLKVQRDLLEVGSEQWEDLTLQIYRLENEANNASSILNNIPDVDFLPSVFEVRRLNQGFGGGGLGDLPVAQNVDNRIVNINIVVNDGADAEDMNRLVQNVAGGDARSFSTGTRRY